MALNSSLYWNFNAIDNSWRRYYNTKRCTYLDFMCWKSSILPIKKTVNTLSVSWYQHINQLYLILHAEIIILKASSCRCSARCFLCTVLCMHVQSGKHVVIKKGLYMYMISVCSYDNIKASLFLLCSIVNHFFWWGMHTKMKSSCTLFKLLGLPAAWSVIYMKPIPILIFTRGKKFSVKIKCK